MKFAAVAALALGLGACVSASATVTTVPEPLPASTTSTTVASVAPQPVTGTSLVVMPDWDPTVGAPIEYPLRQVTEQGYEPFATAGPVTLFHPSDRVEVIGYHESTHDGAQQMDSVESAATNLTMESRDRDTGSQTAADIAIDPTRQVRAPVTGTVLRAGTYVLYCKYSDDFAVIEPTDRPGWEVKVLHINNVRVRAGDTVEAGVTVIADGPTPLPFRSQVDDATSAPSWAHVHIEVIDPSIPDRPSGGGC